MIWRFLKKLKIELSYDLAIPLLGIYISGETMIRKDTHTPMFVTALCTVAKTWKQPKCSLRDEWIKKKWYTHIYNGPLLSHTKNETMPFCINRDGTRDYHSK